MGARCRHALFTTRVILLLLFLLPFLLFAGCGDSEPAEESGKGKETGTTVDRAALLAWPTAYHDVRRTGRGAQNGPQTADTAWVYESGAESKGWAVLGKDGEVVCGLQGKVVSVDPSTGKANWEFSTGEDSATTCCVGPDGTIYTGAGKKVYAINADGTQKWVYDMGYEADDPVLDLDGTVYVGSVGGRLVALTAEGELKWETKVEGDIRTPTIGKEALYCGASPFVLYAFDKKGKKLWECRPEGQVPLYEGLSNWANSLHYPSIGDDGTIYVGSIPYHGYTSTGQTIPGYSVNTKGKLYAVSPQGKILWSYQPQIAGTDILIVFTPSIGRDGTLYCGTSHWRVLAVNREGNLIWEFNAEQAANVCPTLYSPSIGKDGLLYVAGSSGQLFCLQPDGTQKWVFDSGSPWLPGMRGSNGLTPPPLGKDGSLFTLKADGRLYAFRGRGTP